MTVVEISTNALDDVLRTIQRLAADLDEVATPATRRAIVDLTVYAKSIAHVKTGVLRRSLHPEGPFAVADGTLEAVVSPEPAFYAIYEVRRGGNHDYASRTLDEAGQAILARLEQELGRDVAAYVRGA